jgi:GWxTD domain-containing protein
MEEQIVSPALGVGSRIRRVTGAATTLFLAGCGAPPVQPAPRPAASAAAEVSLLESTDVYRRAGFLVGDGSVPFVGIVRYFGTESQDTTMTVVALSIPPRALSFVRAGDRYAAHYGVKIDIIAGQTLVRSERPTGEVRVVSLQETTRGDEGVIFQRALRIVPGTYSIRVTVQDSLGANTGSATGPISVPLMSNGVVAPMFPVYAADVRTTRAAPLIAIANPRATMRYGRDTALHFYMEAYGPNAPDTVVVTSRPDENQTIVLRQDTVVFPKDREPRATRLAIPIARLGLGTVRFTAARTSGVPLGNAAAVVSIGEDAPVTTINELLDALKYFASESDLQVLRDASPEQRPALWAALMRQTDPNPSTPRNEALHEYLRRVGVANAQYREVTRPGWLTDRGAVIVALGEPDAISDPVPSDSTSTTRLVAWEYRRYRLSLVFSDEAGLGRWRLTPASDAEFHILLEAAGPCVGCR